MNRKTLLISNKYAQAFFQEYGFRITDQDFWQIKDTINFLSKNNKLLTYFDWAKPKDMSTLINNFLNRFNLPADFSKLLVLLRKQKRVLLLPSILHCILNLYLKKEGKLFFSIESYPKLSDNQQNSVANFLKNQTNKEILYKCYENKKLISGIKMQSNDFLYNDSIQNKLQSIFKKLIRQN